MASLIWHIPERAHDTNPSGKKALDTFIERTPKTPLGARDSVAHALLSMQSFWTNSYINVGAISPDYYPV